MRIVTTLDHTPNGRPVIRAKADGKQKSTNYDHGLSHDRNHGIAAANLCGVMGRDVVVMAIRSIENGTATHTTENGAKHVFTI